MKKLFAFLLAILMTVSMCACKSEKSISSPTSDNTLFSEKIDNITNYNSVIPASSFVSAASQGTIAVKKDGSVLYVGANFHGQNDCKQWSKICSVTTCQEDVVGVTSDGRIKYAGLLLPDEILSWSDIVAVSGSSYSEKLIGLHSDGTAVVAYGPVIDKKYRFSVDDWTDIVQVSAGAYHCVGLKTDGTVVSVGMNQYSQCDIDNWKDIIYVDAGWDCTVGIKSDGTLIIATDVSRRKNYDYSSWTDLIAVAAHRDGIFGLRADGTVLTTRDDCPSVLDWTNIIQISVGERHVVGLKKDGTLVAADIENWAGDDNSPWLNISDWKAIKTS